MGDDIYELIQILEHSVQKNGEAPLTNKYLLNILRLVEKNIDKRSVEEDIGIFDMDFYKNG